MDNRELEAALADRNDEIADELMLRDERARRKETAYEYIGHVHCNPFRSTPGCVVCDNHDNLHCARGDNCTHTNRANIGEWIGEDRETGHPRNESAYAFEYPTMPGVLFCEDCVCEIDSDEYSGEPILTGVVEEIHWSVHRASDGVGFYGYLVTYDRTHGIAWENELAAVDTLGYAVVFTRTEAERLIAMEAASEAMALAGMPE